MSPSPLSCVTSVHSALGINTCPMCGSMHSGTLDHVLPKTLHPAFAVFGLNLVPACKCNTLRSTALTGPNAGERILHPYFHDVLGERILAARFDDLGPVPRVSLQLLLDAVHPNYAGVLFHVKNVVERTQIMDYLRKLWNILISRPSRLNTDLRHNPATREALGETLRRELDRLDEFHDSRNNWNSIFLAGLLDDDVLDWLFARFNSPGRTPDSSLVP